MRSSSSSDDDDGDNGSTTADGYLLQGSQCGVDLHTDIPGQVELHQHEVIHRVVVLGLLVGSGGRRVADHHRGCPSGDYSWRGGSQLLPQVQDRSQL